jgi:hypothetical protein
LGAVLTIYFRVHRITRTMAAGLLACFLAKRLHATGEAIHESILLFLPSLRGGQKRTSDGDLAVKPSNGS